MQRNDELIIHINTDGKVFVEDVENGVKKVKTVEPDVFINCIRDSIRTGAVSSGILPSGSFHFAIGDRDCKKLCIEFPARYSDIVYMNTEYKNFPLPRLVFGFTIQGEYISCVNLGVVDEGMLTPKSKMYEYPLSNVSGFRLCCGGNRLPRIKSLHQLDGVMHLIMAMPNNNDHYHTGRTKLDMELRNLLETLKDKTPEFYYTDVLIPMNRTLQDFVNS